jgi:hypothetical protein
VNTPLSIFPDTFSLAAVKFPISVKSIHSWKTILGWPAWLCGTDFCHRNLKQRGLPKKWVKMCPSFQPTLWLEHDSNDSQRLAEHIDEWR